MLTLKNSRPQVGQFRRLVGVMLAAWLLPVAILALVVWAAT